MIEFRYPLILFFYAPALIIWLYWIINSRNKMLLSNVDKTLRERLLIKIDKKRLLQKDRFLYLSMLILIFSASL